MYQHYVKICHVIIIVLVATVVVKCDENIITLEQAKIQGNFNREHNYRTFFGIPYATVKERYEEAEDPPYFNKTFKADRGSILCKQFDSTTNTVVGIEDCLTLNVYTPAHITKPLPVIVFIFGGGLYKGSNTDDRYNARYLVQKEVIVVTINYRVGAFGFLCLKTKGAPGNVGIKDVMTGLRWVKNNIPAFGGDPNRITLDGESVGGSTISLFILTQTANKLFQNAIMHSGNVLRPLYFDRNPLDTAAEVATRLGYNTKDPEELVNIFKKATADDIVLATTKNATNNVFERFVFAACAEDPNVSENPVLMVTPKDLLNSVGNVSDISIIMGYDSEEGIMWASDYDADGLRELDNDFSIAIPNSIVFAKEEYRSQFIEDVRCFYFNGSSTTYTGLIDYFSDALVHYPSVLMMEAFVSNPRISLYNYFFQFDSHRNKYKLASPFRSMPGASHCDELYYLYDPLEYRNSTPTYQDAEEIDIMTSLWTNFAHTGIPSVGCSSADFVWVKSEEPLTFLNLDKQTEMIRLPDQERIDFWRRSQDKYGLDFQ